MSVSTGMNVEHTVGQAGRNTPRTTCANPLDERDVAACGWGV
jgi:hypothetical protein